MSKALIHACVLGMLSAAPAAYAYELATHGALTWQAYQRSVLVTDSTRFQDLGIDPTNVNLFGGIYYDVRGVQVRERLENDFERRIIEEDLTSIGANALSISGWLMRGAIREDDLGSAFGQAVGGDPHDDPYGPFWRVMNHFYDPVRNLSLTLSQSSAFLFQQATGESATFRSAPDWAVGSGDVFVQPNTPEVNRRNHFTIFDAREAMYRALTGRDSQGNPLQPAPDGTLTKQSDIRNAYWATAFRALGDILHLNQDMAQPQHTRNDSHGGAPGFGHESVFEEYIDARATGALNYQIDGTLVTPEPLNYGGYPIPAFTKYSDFWSTRDGLSGRGLADYSNRGFFSAGTNLGSNPYLSPSNGAASYAKESAAGLLPTKPLQRLNFLRGDVPDTFTGSSANIRMTTESVFDLFLVTAPPTYSLNRFNYDDMANLLIPRAVAYSAGMINYFFRGKIDLVVDPQNPARLLVKNLGTEPMEGRFTLYYDDAQDNRKRVKDRSGQSVVWSTSALLPATDGVLGPGGAMPVAFDFDSPVDAKTPGEYMLVFNGDMGEEIAGANSIGAVIGKFVQAPTVGTLYISGLDAANKLINLRVDKTGTRVIQSGEFNPLSAVVPFTPSIPYRTLSKAHTLKQVAFSRTLTGWTYKTLAVAFPRNPFFNTTIGLVRQLDEENFANTGFTSWVAQSPDPAVGKFRFRVENTSGQVNLRYTRTFQGLNGQQTVSSIVPLPDELAANFFAFSETGGLVSSDGLHVGEYATFSTTRVPPANFDNFQETTIKQYKEMLIQLAAAPVALPSAIGISYTDTVGRTTIFGDNNTAVSGQSGRTERRVVGHIEGEKKAVESVSESSHSYNTATARTTPKCPPSLIDLVDFQTVTVESDRFPVGSNTFTLSCDNANGPSFEGSQLRTPLTHRFEDAIVFRYENNQQIAYFRSIRLGPDPRYVADYSPLGELFFATTDLSVVVHEPRPGGMPQVQIPPNIVELLAAVWLH